MAATQPVAVTQPFEFCAHLADVGPPRVVLVHQRPDDAGFGPEAVPGEHGEQPPLLLRVVQGVGKVMKEIEHVADQRGRHVSALLEPLRARFEDNQHLLESSDAR